MDFFFLNLGKSCASDIGGVTTDFADSYLSSSYNDLFVGSLDAIVITWLLFNRKGGKRSLVNIGMTFKQLCQKAPLNSPSLSP